jgi:hypothetical protein
MDEKIALYIEVAAYVVAVASVVANFTKNTTDNKVVAIVGKIVRILGAHWKAGK